MSIVRMKFYNCHVRHAGNMLHTIPRNRVSQKELVMLRAIHGDDALDRVAVIGEAKIDMDEHLMQLARTYGRGRVEKVLNVSLDHFDFWLQSKLDDEAGALESRNTGAELAAETRAIQAGADPFDDLETETGDSGEVLDAQEESTDPVAAARPMRRSKEAAVAA